MHLNFLPLLILTLLNKTHAQECGRTKLAQAFVFGGTDAKPGQFPWIVPLFHKHTDGYFCNSNLISAQHLLTAAHCIQEKQSSVIKTKNDIYAYLGRFDLSKNIHEPLSKKENIGKITTHPDWNPKDLRYDADIALLHLENLVTFSDVIQPVCLPPPSLNAFILNGKVAGWGKSEHGSRFEIKPKQIDIPSHGNEDCFLSNYEYAKYSSSRTFCAGERGKNPCTGDSGGGFFFLDSKSLWTVAGLVSVSIARECDQNEFVIFTNVAKFADWIDVEVSRTFSENSFAMAFDAFDEVEEDLSSRTVKADCKYQLTGNSYGCHIKDLKAPNNDIELKIIGGDHIGFRTSRDVSVMQIKGGEITHFPDLTQVANTFPNLDGFGITFTGLKKIKREKLKNLSGLKFFLISDNEIEEIPADTFYDLTNLELLDICRNKVKRIEPAWLTSMPRLRVFKARDNEFEYVPVGIFDRNPVLEEILFDGNKIERNEVDYSALSKIKLVAILRNPCIDLEYCQDPKKPNCVRSLQQFNYLVEEKCGGFEGF